MSFLKLRRLFFAFLCLIPTLTWAQSKSVIPYSGSLYSQGKPISQNDAVSMGFALYAFDDGTPSESIGSQFTNQTQAPASNLVWTSWQNLYTETGEFQAPAEAINVTASVPVYVRNGAFLVHLGDLTQGNQPSLYDSIFSLYSESSATDGSVDSRTAQVLYLVIWVQPDPTADPKRLPPQKLNTVPHAITARQAVDFEVKGDLKVKGNVQVEGSIRTSGDLNFNNQTLISNDGGDFDDNIDHIWHDDDNDVQTNPDSRGVGGIWHFVSDGEYKAPGDAGIRVKKIIPGDGVGLFLKPRVYARKRNINADTGGCVSCDSGDVMISCSLSDIDSGIINGLDSTDFDLDVSLKNEDQTVSGGGDIFLPHKCCAGSNDAKMTVWFFCMDASP